MHLAKWLIIGGIGLIVVGIFLWTGLPLGKLPGDFHIKGEKSDIYIPLATSLLISIALTVVLNLLFWWMRK